VPQRRAPRSPHLACQDEPHRPLTLHQTDTQGCTTHPPCVDTHNPLTRMASAVAAAVRLPRRRHAVSAVLASWTPRTARPRDAVWPHVVDSTCRRTTPYTHSIHIHLFTWWKRVCAHPHHSKCTHGTCSLPQCRHAVSACPRCLAVAGEVSPSGGGEAAPVGPARHTEGLVSSPLRVRPHPLSIG